MEGARSRKTVLAVECRVTYVQGLNGFERLDVLPEQREREGEWPRKERENITFESIKRGNPND